MKRQLVLARVVETTFFMAPTRNSYLLAICLKCSKVLQKLSFMLASLLWCFLGLLPTGRQWQLHHVGMMQTCATWMAAVPWPRITPHTGEGVRSQVRVPLAAIYTERVRDQLVRVGAVTISADARERERELAHLENHLLPLVSFKTMFSPDILDQVTGQQRQLDDYW